MLTSSQPRGVVLAEARPSRKGQDSSTGRHTPEGSRWITVHPNGPDSDGQPVLISGSGQVLGGMGGKFNGQHVGDVAGWKQAGTPKPGTYGVGGTHEGYNQHLATYGGAKAIADVTVHGQPVRHAGGTFSVRVAGGKGIEKTLNQHGQAQTAGGAFLERHPDGGVIYHGGMGAPDTWHEFARHMSEDLLTHSAEHEHRRMMGRADTTPYKDEHEAEGHAYRKAAMKQVRDFIRAEGGIRAGRTRTVGQELQGTTARTGDEYRHQLPSWAKNANGKHTTDQMARLVGDTFPHLGVETEDDLREYLMGHERQRKADAAKEAQERAAKIAAAQPAAPAEQKAATPAVAAPEPEKHNQAQVESYVSLIPPAKRAEAARQLRRDLDRGKSLRVPGGVADAATMRAIADRLEGRQAETPQAAPAQQPAAQTDAVISPERHERRRQQVAEFNRGRDRPGNPIEMGYEEGDEFPFKVKRSRDGQVSTAHRDYASALQEISHLENNAPLAGWAKEQPAAPARDRPTWDTAPRGEEGDYANGHLRFNRQSWQTFAVDHPASIAEYNRLHGEGKRDTPYDPSQHHVIHPLTGSAGDHPVAAPQLASKAAVAEQSKYIKRGSYSPEQQAAVDHLNAQKVKPPAADAVPLFADLAVKDRPKPTEKEKKRREGGMLAGLQEVAMPYKTTRELPPAVRDHLPPDAQDMFRKVVNSALSQYDGDEDKAFATAWAAVKRDYEQGKDGEWHKKKDEADVKEADLSAKKRDSLKDSQFAYVDDEGVGHLPINDAGHVRNALSRIDQTDMPDSARAGALRKIKAAAKRFGVDVSEAVDLSPDDDDEEETGPDTDDDPLGTVGAHLEKDEHHPDRLIPKRHHTRGRDGKYNGSETILHKGSGPRTAARMTESVALSEAGTDRARREVLLQIISPGFGSSRDPKSGLPVYYTRQALQEAAPLFSRKKCYLNHSTPAERKSRPEGDITRWGATVKEAWWDPQRQALVGRTRVVNSNLWEAIELDPDEVAVSIHAHGNGRTGTAEGKNAWLVESIDAVHSVDFVTYAGARGGVIHVLESDRATVRFTETEQREAERDMFEDITERDLRESRPDLVEAVIAGQQKPPTVDLTEALRPYEERVHLLECELNRRDARSLVDKALAACGLPAPAAERLRVQFSEATYGLADSPYESDAALVEAVGKAGSAEAEYIKSVTAAPRAITGMGASTPATATTGTGTGTGTGAAPGRPVAANPADRAVLREAQTRLDNLLKPVAHKGPPPKDDATGGGAATPSHQSRMDSLLRSAPAKG